MVIIIDVFTAIIVGLVLLFLIGDSAFDIILWLLCFGGGMGAVHLLATFIAWLLR
jgi:hypothetical protein